MRLTPPVAGQFYVKSASGAQVPLATLVKISMGVEPNRLTHPTS